MRSLNYGSGLALLLAVLLSRLSLALCTDLPSLQAMCRQGTDVQLNVSCHGWVGQNRTRKFLYRWTKPLGEGLAPFRIHVEAGNAQQSNWPLVVVAKQGGSVLTLTLPYMFAEHSHVSAYNHDLVMTQYRSLSRSLCPTSGDPLQQQATVELSSSSRTPIMFSLLGTLAEHFELRPNDALQTAVEPAMPQYFWFNFSANEAALVGASAVRVVVRSNDSGACLMLAVQASRCPVWDTPESVDHSGLHQTILTKGDIHVSRAEFPTFFVVLLSYPNGSPCQGVFDADPPTTGKALYYNYSKPIWIEIVRAPETNYRVVAATTGFCLAFVLAVFGLALCGFRRPKTTSSDEETGSEIEDLVYDAGVVFDYMSVAVLSQKATDRHPYTLQLCVICAFYSLPAIQLMLVLCKNIYNTGDLDSCFYNYACSVKQHLASGLDIYAFNNVFSNVGYLAAGIAFLLMCGVKQYYSDGDCATGVPVTYSLFYASGAAVAMEGVMSATYHLCPSYYNFQFDTAFMLMLAGLLILLLYSKRHPDASATAHIAYLALGAFILANTLGILFAEAAAAVVYPLLGLLHLSLTLWIALQVYYLGELSPRDLLARRTPTNFPYPPDPPSSHCTCSCSSRWCHLQPRYPSTLAFLCLAVALNFAAAGVSFARAAGRLLGLQFANFFLGVMIMNFLLYLLFYLAMKLRHAGRSDWRRLAPVAALLAAVGLLSAGSLSFFSGAPTNWMQSPAGSRAHNTDCVLLGEYDKHDVWHFLSAAALFSLLMLLLCVDANDDGKRREELPVF